MKKHILATLLVAVTGVASAQVAITGKIGQIVDRTSGETTLVTEPTSNITLSAKEDLGGGLQARAVFDTSLRGSTLGGTGTQIGDRQSTVGLGNKLGSVDLGRNVHSQFLAVTNNDVFGTLYGSIAGDVHNLRSLRFSDAVFASVNGPMGVTATYDRTQNNVGGQASAYSLSKSFAGVNGTFAQYELGAEKTSVVGLNTKVAGNTVSYVHSEDKGLVAKKGDSIGVARDLGPITAKASYGRTNNDVRAYALGADYNLSKRTAVTVAYRNVDAAQDIKQVGVGLVHKF
jgi:predicted porin